ncbi:MAG: hypothetical protein JW806_09305 [Sedimentisphaerales bacterium]|nr:hypothetical protein [Sedimentisphaerales bacterium]
MNKKLQEEGYYMGEFEFKLMGILYYLDRGQYRKALSTLSRFHRQLKNKENLIKIPEFKDAQEEMDFYLNLQNPKTGAFMDDSFPYCTFNAPTGNIIAHLDLLAKELGVRLKLKYPLKYLDEINTPAKLYAFLDDVSNVSWLGSRFPETSFFFARDLADWDIDGAVTRNNLYNFSDDYKTALLKWFYDNQDPATGYWGPKNRRTGRSAKIDLDNTASLIKLFVDRNGNDIHESFPIKNKDKIFKTTLEFFKKPVPGDDELAEWHGWHLEMNKGIKMLLRYLWKDASNENKQAARQVIEDYVKILFERFYVPAEGAFSYYPDSEHASLDGTGGFIFKDIGAYSYEKQKKLWGPASENIKDLGRFETVVLSLADLDSITKYPEINSLRIYSDVPDYNNLTDNAVILVYPHETKVLDVMELIGGIKKWLDTTTLSSGNWSSRVEIEKQYSSLNIKEPIIYRQTFPLEKMNEILRQEKEFYIIGFDILQIPRYKIVYLKSSEK